jgi:F-type H+-transporting ATPase subunit c
MKTWILLAVVAACLLVPAAVASAQATGEGEEEPPEGPTWPKSVGIVGACIGAGIVSVGGGLGIARIGGKCIESIARQPEAAGPMFAPMIITAAMVEGGMLFAIVVCLLGVLGI